MTENQSKKRFFTRAGWFLMILLAVLAGILFPPIKTGNLFWDQVMYLVFLFVYPLIVVALITGIQTIFAAIKSILVKKD